MSMSREDRELIEDMTGQIRAELAAAAVHDWIDRAASGADPGPYPGDPPGWAERAAADPGRFREYLGGLAGAAQSRHDRRREALAAELAAAELADRRALAAALGVAALAAAVLGVAVVVVVVRRRRRRARPVREATPAPAYVQQPAPVLGLRL